MNKLDKLAQKHGTDKWGKHHYTSFYHKLFKDKREIVRKMVELGTAEGAGLKMWHDYFPNATIFGADIEPERVPQSVLNKYRRIVMLQSVDQASERDLVRLVEIIGSGVSLFVDDGSHKPEDQVFTCKTVMPLLNEGVIYVIEDVADQSILEDLIKNGYEALAYKFSKRYDDRLIVVKHK